jgi:hypothetical protein
VQILGSQVPVTCPVVAVPSIDHDHTVSSAQEEQSEQTSAAVAPGGGSAARKTGVGTSRSPLVVVGIDGSAESLAAARYAEAVSSAGRPYGTRCSGAFGLHVYGLRPPTVDPVIRERMAVLCRGSNG